jgi:bacillithiol biosynthesis cysteine-adding enzyme BshC
MPSIPLERYPGLPSLFLDFARGASRFYPDPPTIDAALVRGSEILAKRDRAGLSTDAFRFRAGAGRQAAEDLAAGRAVAVLAGHQIGLLTGPLYTLVKAFDAIVFARELSSRGLPAVPVFWALTDDHDLEEIARTAKPGPEGPRTFLLEGADRSNRHPVGQLEIPGGVRGILEAFREDAQGAEAEEFLEIFSRRYAPGKTYGEAFVESLLDMTEGDPLVVVDPLGEEVSEAARKLFVTGLERRADIQETLRRAAAEIAAAGHEPSVPFRPDLFPFFVIEEGIRRRIEAPDLERVGGRVARGELAVSADVLTRPVLKSVVLPAAASVLGPSEIGYHAQSIPLFPILGAVAPVLLARTFVVPRGPAERRAARALGVADEELLTPGAAAGTSASVPQADRMEEIARRLESELTALAPDVERLDPTLAGALETARRKATYQLEQLGERMRKAAERKDEVTLNRRRRLETMLLPGGQPAERVYPPLVFLQTWGRGLLEVLRAVAGGGGHEIRVVDVDGPADSQARASHAG